MKKGFTLVELIATVVVLSIVALLVVPNIYSSISNYRQKLYETQLSTIEMATKNWHTDHIRDVELNNDGDTKYVYLCHLSGEKDEQCKKDSSQTFYSYIDKDLKNPLTSEPFNDLVFTVITYKEIESDGENNSNYDYKYRVIDTTKKYMEYLAEVWTNEHSLNVSSVTNKILVKTLNKNDLLPYIDSTLLIENTEQIKDIETSRPISDFSADIYVEKINEKYVYTYEGKVGK